MKAAVIICVTFFLFSRVWGQGSVTGTLFDSAYHFVLPSATVAVYNAADNTLIQYRLTNNLGEFRLEKLPLNVGLRLVASYVGYEQTVLKVVLTEKEPDINVRYIHLRRAGQELKEVVVTAVPPVSMHNDTLEFNADAFKLDSNAVAEDLLSRLPGVVVWGDGTITVNGQEVKSLMVNGKPFFGGDATVATRNIPKTAIDKVQVYNKNTNPQNRLDSSMEVNIKLKAEKSTGYFGKAGGGYGSDSRYEADGGINGFSPRTQLGIAGAANNTNKVPGNLDALLKNSTFKEGETDRNYQSDFQTPGINRSTALGMLFQHDFIPDANFYKNNRLTAHYFLKAGDVDSRQNTQTQLYLGPDSVQKQSGSSNSTYRDTRQELDGEYAYHYGKTSLSIRPDLVLDDAHNNQQSNNSVIGISTGSTTLEDNLNDKKASMAVQYNKGFELDYSARLENATGFQHKLLSYSSLNTADDQNIDRQYFNTVDSSGQHLYFLSNSYKGIQFLDDFDYRHSDISASVYDRDTANAYLTNTARFHAFSEVGGLVLSRSFLRQMTNRFEHTWNVSATPMWQYYYEKNGSPLHDFQDFSRSYTRFVPRAALSYRNNQYGAFEDDYSLSYGTETYYPGIDQLYPLVDSSNVYYISMGNGALKPSTKRTLDFFFTHGGRHISYGFSLSAGLIGDNITDSSIVQSDGKTYTYKVNADGSRFGRGSAQVKRQWKWRLHELQLAADGSLGLQRTPSYTNGVYYAPQVLNDGGSVSLNYMYAAWFSAALVQRLSYYHSLFNSSNADSYLDVSANLTKRWRLNSNIEYYRYTSTGSSANQFTLWNAGTSYRLLKGNNLEVSFRALDLLHQNKGIINTGSNTAITHETVNVLQNYFILSIHYFPRYFGLHPPPK